ncbi:uncharacterized protein EAF01_003527 [Botrytis porri]|uniref:uncharacterized protein n=1 Tax=Botrytis porri TaxID=87229 RepID=UPI001902A769|nr:uncharacterized protein EAF01_003527 [Botrytis porri]KAF7909809.1 hypothetical protein EAF01_003527 [Botrytis porri]
MLSMSPEDIPMVAFSKNAMDPKVILYKDLDDNSHEFYFTPAAAAPKTRESVRGSVSWHKQRTSMVLFAVLGIDLACTHHGYYSYLDGKQGTSNFHKPFSITLGSLLAFCVVSSFLAANCAAHLQNHWSPYERKHLR